MQTRHLTRHPRRPRRGRHPLRRLILAGAPLFALPAAAGAQCEWEAFGSGAPGSGPDEYVAGLAEFEGDLYVLGGFASVGGGLPETRGIARWNGADWESVGGGLADGDIDDWAVLDGALYICGGFTSVGGVPANRVAKWDGVEWSSLGSGAPSGWVSAVEAFDGAIYLGGSFSEPGNSIARWDGESWSELGSGIGTSSRDGVLDLTVFDDGSGAALYAGGRFTTAGGMPANNVAKWNGAAWSALGDGVTTGGLGMWALGVFDGELYAGINAASSTDEALYRWDGVSWVEGGIQGANVRDLHVFDDGTGPALYAIGDDVFAGGVSLNSVGKWDGESWVTLDQGVIGDYARALGTFNGDLVVGGRLTEASGIPVDNIARWTCDSVCYADCDASGDLDFFDFLCFQNLFAAGAPEADCDESGDLDFFDFLCFQNKFSEGCP